MTGTAYFEAMYDASSDPWDLATSAYERRKYDITVAALPRPQYGRAFEPACSIGVLTQMLAPRCGALVATDPIPAAVEAARRRCADLDVAIELGAMPDDWPGETFDLIVISELLYFLDERSRHRTLHEASAHLDSRGHLLLVHWRHDFREAECTGDEAHDDARRLTGLPTLVRHEERDFILEVLGGE